MARMLTNEFLIEFDPPPGARLRYDYSDTAAMQENQNELTHAVQRGLEYVSQLSTLDEVQEASGIRQNPRRPVAKSCRPTRPSLRDADIEGMADAAANGEDPIGPPIPPVSPDDPPEPPEPTDPDA